MKQNTSAPNCAVILDIDGTLVPILVDFDSLRERVKKLLGVDKPLRPLGESLAQLEISSDLKDKAWSIIEEAEEESVKRLDPFEVARNVEFVKNLSSQGIDIYFVTARSSRTALKLLSKLGLQGYARDVVTRDYSVFRKEQLRLILEKAKGKKVIFIGDTVYDEASASSVGIAFMRVKSYRDLPELLSTILEFCRSTQ